MAIANDKPGQFTVSSDSPLRPWSGPPGTRWKALVFVIGAGLSVCAFLLRPVLHERALERVLARLDRVQAELDRNDVDAARSLAERAVTHARHRGGALGLSLMYLGLTHAADADRREGHEGVECWSLASQAFAEALRMGVPPAHEGRLVYQLGRCLMQQGEYEQGIPLLQDSLDSYPEGRADALRMLSIVQMTPQLEDLNQALRANQLQLKEPGQSQEQVVEAWQARRVLLRKLHRADLLADIDPVESPHNVRWVGHLVEAAEVYQHRDFEAAARACNAVLKLKDVPDPVAARSLHILALCAREQGDFDNALAMLNQIDWRFPNTSDAVAGLATASSIMLMQGDTESAVTHLARLGKANVDTKGWAPVVPPMSDVFESAVRTLRDRGQFESAARVLEVYGTRDRTQGVDGLAARLYESWARFELSRSEGLDPGDAQQSAYRAAELYRMAGSMLVRHADAASTHDQATELLVAAAEDFYLGEGLVQAAEVVDRLLTAGIQGERRAEIMSLGSAVYDMLGKHEDALDLASACVEQFPDHIAAVRARYHLARCQIGFGETEQAEATLRIAMDKCDLVNESHYRTLARLLLAHLLHEDGRVDEAMLRLDEILGMDPAGEIAQESRLLLAICLRNRSALQGGADGGQRSQHTRAHLRQRKQQDLDRALAVLRDLESELGDIESAGQLAMHQADWLVQCRLEQGRCLVELDDIPGAIASFSRLMDSVDTSGDWLEAGLELFHCHMRSGDELAAMETIRVANERLRQLPRDEMEQVRLTLTPERWGEFQHWVRKL